MTINKRIFSRNELINLSINVSNDRSSRVKYIETAILTKAKIAQPSLTGVCAFHTLKCFSHFSRQKVNVSFLLLYIPFCYFISFIFSRFLNSVVLITTKVFHLLNAFLQFKIVVCSKSLILFM